MKKIALTLALILLTIAAMAQDSKQTFTRKVLIEQFTTAMCGYCPIGAERITEAIGSNKNIVWIKHHAGFYTDDLTNNIHETLTCFYGGSTYAPAMMLDRTHFSQSDPGPVMNVGNVSDIRSKLAVAKEVPTYCKIYTPTTAFDPASRHLSGTVSGRFGDAVYNENTRLIVFLIEDSIFMEQHDYVNGSSANSYAVDYWHMGTVREAITDMWGDAFTVNEDDNRSFSYTIDFTLPEGYNYNYCKVAAFIYNYDPEDINNCKVMNTAESDYISNNLSIGELNANTQFRLFPNPAASRVVLESDAPISHISLVNTLGQEVLRSHGHGATSASISVSDLAAGLYIVRINTANGMATRQLVVK